MLKIEGNLGYFLFLLDININNRLSEVGMDLKNKKETIVDFMFILAGCCLLAFAISSILRPNGLVTGGITGLSIILSNVIDLEYTIIYYILTIVVLISAFAFMGKREGLRILGLSVLFPIVLVIFESQNFHFIESDLFLSSIYYGMFGGIGVGLMIKRGFSMGGSDTIAKILHRKAFNFVSISQIMMVIDVAIILSSTLVLDRNIALYAIITQIVFKKTIDIVIFGFGNQKVKLEIVSMESDKIEDFILHEVRRGVTSYTVKGGYTDIEKEKLITICSPRESSLIRRFISQTDKGAFVTVLPVSSVWGVGIGFDRFDDEI